MNYWDEMELQNPPSREQSPEDSEERLHSKLTALQLGHSCFLWCLCTGEGRQQQHQGTESKARSWKRETVLRKARLGRGQDYLMFCKCHNLSGSLTKTKNLYGRSLNFFFTNIDIKKIKLKLYNDLKYYWLIKVNAQFIFFIAQIKNIII